MDNNYKVFLTQFFYLPPQFTAYLPSLPELIYPTPPQSPHSPLASLRPQLLSAPSFSPPPASLRPQLHPPPSPPPPVYLTPLPVPVYPNLFTQHPPTPPHTPKSHPPPQLSPPPPPPPLPPPASPLASLRPKLLSAPSFPPPSLPYPFS